MADERPTVAAVMEFDAGYQEGYRDACADIAAAIRRAAPLDPGDSEHARRARRGGYLDAADIAAAADDGAWIGGRLLCRPCDAFVGYGASGVARRPDEPAGWLESHCWVCGRNYQAQLPANAGNPDDEEVGRGDVS